MEVDTQMPETLPTAMPKMARFQECEFAREARAEDSADAVDPAAPEKPRRYRVIITTETPRRTWAGMETLSHTRSAIDMSLAKRGISCYLEHGGSDLENPRPELHVGIVEDIELNEQSAQLEGWLRFSRHELAQSAEQDVIDRTRIWVSGQYVPIAVKETKPRGANGEPREYTVTRWRPVECGLVGIPADPKAVVKRSEGGVQYPVEIEPVTPAEESTTMEPANTQTTPAAGSPTAGTDAAVVGDRAARSAGGSAGGVQILEREDAAKIMELCASHGAAERAPEFLRRGLSLAEAGLEILGKMKAGESHLPGLPSAESLGVSKREARRYSYARALRMSFENSKPDGLEGAVHKAIEEKLPPFVQRRSGILVPMRLEEPDWDQMEPRREARALGTGVAGGGAELVYDQPGEFVDLLRNKMLLTQFGARMLTGLRAPIPFPKATGDPVVRWMSENPASPAAASQPSFTTVTATPRTMIGSVPIPRQLLELAIMDVEADVRNRLVMGHSLSLDREGFHGPGANGKPLGLWNTPGVNVVNFGSAPPTLSLLVDMETAVAEKNADLATMGYITTPGIMGKTKKTQIFNSTNGLALWQGGILGELNGMKAGATMQISKTMSGLADTGGSEHGVAFGDWSAIYVCFWGALQLQSESITLADYGQIKVTSFNLGDIVNTRPEVFAVSNGATLA